MKKVFTFKIATLTLLVALLVSCSGGSTDSYKSLIPKDVTQVYSIDMTSLAEKSGLGDAENDGYKALLLESVGGDASGSAEEVFGSVVNDPYAMGVDFDEPLYIFVPNSDILAVGMVAKMGDKAKFEVVINELINQNHLKPIVENDSFAYSETQDGSFAVLYTEIAILMAIQTEDSREYPAIRVGSEIFDASKVENISGNKAFEKMEATKGDIKFFASYEALPNDIKSQFNATANIGGADFTGMTIIGSLGFGMGDISLSLMSHSDDPELQKMIKESLNVAKEMNGSLLKKFPNNSLAVISSYIGGSSLVDKIEENPELAKYLDGDDEATEALKFFLETINGDMALSVVSFGSLTDFTVLGYVEMDAGGAEALEALVNNKDINHGLFKKIEENRYAYNTGFMSVYLGVKNDLLYITNKKEFPLGENISPSVSETYPDAKGKSMFLAVNVKDIYSLLKSMRLTRSVPSELREPLEQVNTVEASITKDGVMNYRITLLKEDVNSLKFFLDYAKEMVD